MNLTDIAGTILSEAGIVSFVLFVVCLYSAYLNRILRQDNRRILEDNDKLHDRIYELGMEQIKTNKNTNNILDKIIVVLGRQGGEQ